MSDNTELNPGTGGDIIASDDIAGIKYQRVKLIIGADGTNNGDVASGNPMPVTGTITAVTAISNALPAGNNNIGDVDIVTMPSVTLNALPAGTNNIGDVDVLSVPAPLNVVGTGTEAAALRVTIATDSTGVLSVDDNGSTISIDDGASSITVDYATTGSGNATGALRVELANNGTGLVGLNAGTNAIGKLAANSGVDIGDVDVTSIAAGTNAIGNVGIIPRASGGLTTYHLASANTVNQVAVKGSAGQLFGWYIYNSNAAARKIAFHNTTTPSAGASVLFSLVLPPTSAANTFSEIGIPFSTGIGISTVTGLADNDTAAVATNDLIINLWYA